MAQDDQDGEKLGVKISRDAEIVLEPFTKYFRGFDRVPAVRALFNEATEKVLNNLRVEFFSSKFGYMGVSDEDGHILISTHHLKNSDFKILYLDIVHELCHVKQFMDGKQIFSSEFEYVDSPIEVEAYKMTVKEAKRIGMTNDEISEYLKVEWINEEQHKRLVQSVELN